MSTHRCWLFRIKWFDVTALFYFVTCLIICAINTHGVRPFPVNISKDHVTRAIRIFVVGARGIQTLVDQDLQFLVMMTSSNGNIFRVTGTLCEEFTGHREALMFSLISAWTNGWVNNWGAGDIRRHRAHYDVIVMSTQCLAHRHLL